MFAARTKVPVAITRTEIERLIQRYKCDQFLAHIVMPDGRRFGEITIPQLEHMGSDAPLLEHGGAR